MIKINDSEEIELKREKTFRRKHDEIVAELVKPGDSAHKVNPRVHIDPIARFTEVDEKFGDPDAKPWFMNLGYKEPAYRSSPEDRERNLRFLEMYDYIMYKNKGRYVMVEKSAKLTTEAPVVK